MVRDWAVSADRLTHTFTLRDGLAFHDGAPVTAEDCIASIARWAKRDIVGLRLAAVTTGMTALDARTFRITLSQPFGIMLDALSKIGSVPLFIMPKRVAETPPEQALRDAIGSGPYRFVAGAFNPGVRWSYERNAEYVPRNEPASGLAGGKRVTVDRFEVIYFPNKQTALNALQRGEIDAVESFGADQLSIVAGDRNVVTSRVQAPTAPTIRFNWAQPPFDDVMARRAVQAAVTQRDYLEAEVGDPAHYELCGAIFGCGTPLASNAGVVDVGRPDIAKGRALLAQSRYAGETVVMLNPSDIESFQPLTALTHQILGELGMRVTIQAMDWNTFLQRRTISAPVSQGGWNITHAVFTQLDFNSPLTNPNFDARGTAGYTGFVDDPETEALKTRFQQADTAEERKAIAEEMQKRAYDLVFYIPLGNYYDYSATRPGFRRPDAPLFVGWGIEA
jgi:peptide/nickel transport system substrate-binding protein